MNTRSSEFLSGTFLTACALFFWKSSGHLHLGSLTSMGPGYFPRLLSIMLGGIGIVLVVRGLRAGDTVTGASISAVPVIFATAIFGFLIEPLGLLVASAAMVAIASLSMRTTLPQTLALSVASAAIAGTLSWGIGLPLPLLPPALLN